MAELTFNRDLEFEYGAPAQVTPLIRRVVAKNPSAFTLHGTGTYDHGLLRCDLTEPRVSLEDVEGDAYFLIVALDKHDPAGPRESSYGRDSFGVERPSGIPSCKD